MVTEQGLADKVPGLSPYFSQTCSFSFRVPCEISPEESVLLFHTQTLKSVGAHSTTEMGQECGEELFLQYHLQGKI